MSFQKALLGALITGHSLKKSIYSNKNLILPQVPAKLQKVLFIYRLMGILRVISVLL